MWNVYYSNDNTALKNWSVQVRSKFPMKTAIATARVESYSELFGGNVMNIFLRIFFQSDKFFVPKKTSTRYSLMKSIQKIPDDLCTTSFPFQIQK